MASFSKKPDKMGTIRSLNPDDAFSVLLALLKQNPGLEETVYQIATQILCDTESDEIMYDVHDALDSLDVDDLFQRSGKTRHGYVEPYEEAWVMIEEALEPFIDEMDKYRVRGMPDMAKKYCVGIIKGLQNFKDDASDILDWAPDAPGENINDVFNKWKEGRPSKEDIAEVSAIMNGSDDEE